MPTALPLIPPSHDADPHAAVLVGFSGGLDSTVLLHRLAQDPAWRARGVRAIHVHHGLQPAADDWAAHCLRICAALGIPLRVVHVSVDDTHGDGPEAAARRARHAAFSAALEDGGILALAHHRDDQAETFLLRALRASGVDGLAAMRDWRAYARGWLWRPLLATPRARLLDHARRHGLAWIEDPSNAGDTADRNFLRNRVMPLLRQRWPHADAAFARSAALQAGAARLLAAADAAALSDALGDAPGTLSVSALSGLPPERRARVLRRWIAEAGLPALPAEGIARIERDLIAGDGSRVPAFVWRDAIVRRWRDRLSAGRQRPALPRDYRVAWTGAAPLRLPTGDLFALEAATGRPALPPDLGLVVHARQGGERILLPGRAHSHQLKHVLQAQDVPPWQRDRMPLLSAADGTLLAAGDRIVSATFARRLADGGLRLRWSAASAADGPEPAPR